MKKTDVLLQVKDVYQLFEWSQILWFSFLSTKESSYKDLQLASLVI